MQVEQTRADIVSQLAFKNQIIEFERLCQTQGSGIQFTTIQSLCKSSKFDKEQLTQSDYKAYPRPMAKNRPDPSSTQWFLKTDLSLQCCFSRFTSIILLSKLIQHHSQLQLMSQDQPSLIKIHIYHELIGNHTLEFSGKNHSSDLRLHLIDNSPLYLYQNFHLEYQGVRLVQTVQIWEILKNDSRLTVVFQPFDYYSSKYHEGRVREILETPAHWIIANSRDYSTKTFDSEGEDFPEINLDQLFDNPFYSPLLNSQFKKESQFANMIHTSGFNPPPYTRKLAGDLYYLQVRTLEETDIHVTASSEGFFVNQSTQGNFNPNSNLKYSLCLSLLDLLINLSPKFKLKFNQIQKSITITEFQRLSQGAKPIAEHSVWLKESKCWKKSNVWKNDSSGSLEKEDFVSIKDWVEIFQYQRASPNDSLFQKMGREKLRYRIYQQFIENVKEAVINIFKGTIKPINVSTKFERQIFYFSNILFYFANDSPTKDNFLPSGHSANRDLLTLGLVDQVDTENVYLSHSIVVNYRGYKVVAKTMPNSLINAKIEANSIKDVFRLLNRAQSDENIVEAVRKLSKLLAVQSQSNIIDQNGKSHLVCLHNDLTACVSNDNKKFIIQMAAFGIRDLNFNSNESLQHFMRPQLIKIFNSKQKCGILCNPNAGTTLTLAANEKHKQQLKKNQSIAKFAKEIMIPSIIDGFNGDLRKYLADSKSIIETMHKYGLSSRYLGLLCKKAVEKKTQQVKIMVQRAIFVRSVKNVFKKALRETALHQHKSLIKHLMNCIFQETEDETEGGPKQTKNEDEVQNNGKKSKKKKAKENESCFEISFAKSSQRYLLIKHSKLWQEVRQTAFIKFKHELTSKKGLFQNEFSKSAILRDLCLCLGIQIQKRDYFGSQNGPNFTEQQILNIVPKLKIVLNDPKELLDFIEEGDKLVNKFQIQEAFQMYNKAFQYIFSAFGGSHEKLGLMYKKFASLHYKIGDFEAAVVFAMNSLEIYQNLRGLDHVQTIQALLTVGIYEFARKKLVTAQYYILKAIFLAKFAYSQCYPEIIVMHMNLSTVYESQRKYTDAIMSLFMALNISSRVYGPHHLHTAIILSALASLHYDIPDIQQAIKFQEKCIAILEEQLGAEDERVLQARSTCEGYRNIQNSKKIREVHEKEQKNMFGLPLKGKYNFKMPFVDIKESSSQFFLRKPKKLKYFF